MIKSKDAGVLILNVDDSEGARYAKSRILLKAGFTIIEAINGEEALNKARTQAPVLILLDVKLPDINGMEVCQILKSDPNTRNILVLQTSASFIGSADKIKALDGGADNYLVEPIEPEELVANVNALLRLGKVERELRDADRRRNEFLATLAHELRNPLAPIRNAVEILQRLNPDAADAEKYAMDVIVRHTNHLAHLVNDLLDISRISKGKISLRWEIIALSKIIDSAIETSSPVIAQQNHILNVKPIAKEVFVHGDQVRLIQMLSNILINASKFTEPGGEILLETRLDGENITISIKDNGIGIQDTNLESIFELFTQSGTTKDTLHEGLGIGLALVKGLAVLHGGDVKAFSDGVGLGSTFEIVLPITESQQNIDVTAEAPKEFFIKRIVVIDDNRDAAQTLAELLIICGHQAKTAFTSKEGIEMVQEFEPDFVFLDIGLPDKDGYETATELKQTPNRLNFKLIALTGFGQEKDKQKAIDAGFDEYATKPLDLKRLTEFGISI